MAVSIVIPSIRRRVVFDICFIYRYMAIIPIIIKVVGALGIINIILQIKMCIKVTNICNVSVYE